ncbi:hypothetical protein G5V59_26950 [Nocardioides sp. W3-2-3]|uniref:hypothetical protein n=1 Tax=Nocardioides convexus TaxID=2712224 RepID=UPI0024181985|nr:hypothetical protein [Nocardioides convexus]NHA02031.1 hypothetical protein [Nocardioides convexus]
MFTTTTLTFVRTKTGVVKVAAGERVPTDALPSAIERLLSLGAIVEEQGPPPATADEILAAVGDDPLKAQEYLDAERTRSKPRAGLIARLEAILAAAQTSTDPEVEDPEA